MWNAFLHNLNLQNLKLTDTKTKVWLYICLMQDLRMNNHHFKLANVAIF